MWSFLGIEPYEEKCLVELDPLSVLQDPGIYVLSAGNGTLYTYPRGDSSIFYIGCTRSLSSRLAKHKRRVRRLLKGKVQTDLPRYVYAAHHHGRVAAFLLSKEDPRESLQDLESKIICLFAIRYGSRPVANAAASLKTLKRAVSLPLRGMVATNWIRANDSPSIPSRRSLLRA